MMMILAAQNEKEKKDKNKISDQRHQGKRDVMVSFLESLDASSHQQTRDLLYLNIEFDVGPESSVQRRPSFEQSRSQRMLRNEMEDQGLD
jgi:hypothetical protein